MYNIGDYVVCPGHGVGQVADIETKKLADQALQAAMAAQLQRTEMVSRVTSTYNNVEQATSRSSQTTALLDSAKIALDSARIKRDAAISAVNQCEGEEELRRADQELRDEEFEIVRMEERLQHVTSADAAAAAASAVLLATKITEQRREKIRTAEIKLKTEQGILNSASPKLTITALESVAVSIDGESLVLDTGQMRTVAVSETVLAKIGRTVELRVEPGTNAETLIQAITAADSVLAKACAEAGVSSPEEAEKAWAAFLDAKRTVTDRDRIAKEHLRDLTRDELSERIKGSRASVEAYLARRCSTVVLPATSAECKALLQLTTKAASEAKTEQKNAEAVFAKVQDHYTKCLEDHSGNAALLLREQRDHEAAVARVEADRKRCCDEDLRAAQESAANDARNALENFSFAENGLKGADPESAKLNLESAALTAKNVRETCETEDRTLLVLRTTLDLAGDAGLAEALAEAERVTFEAEDSLRRLMRRAGAAKRLYETLRAERESMRQAYVAPLRDRIERLGRNIFGPTLRVEVNEKLQVVSRTVDGVTVSIKQLSTGAQEQVGLLVRLAAASMVSKDGGVPLILDDALGATDEGRLEAMGAVLRLASQDSQTIILTCAPERYVHVGAMASTVMGR
jgi:hypothetical protein